MAVQLHRSPPRKNTRFSYSFLKVALLKSRAGRVFNKEQQSECRIRQTGADVKPQSTVSYLQDNTGKRDSPYYNSWQSFVAL